MSTGKITVLLFDEEFGFHHQVIQALAKDRYIEPSEASSMEIRLGKAPDVAVIDADMNAQQVEKLKKEAEKGNCALIFITSHDVPAARLQLVSTERWVRKPLTSADLQRFLSELMLKIKAACAAKKQKNETAKELTDENMKSSAQNLPSVPENSKKIIAIGASTGGTEAVLAVVKDLPANTPGIVVVQHMPPVFTNMYAQRLDKACKMSVKEAQDYDRVLPGRIIIAAGEYHMRLKKDSGGYYIRSEQGERVNGHCPSVDVLFHSVAETAGKDAVGVILTGMGADGAKGLLHMHEAGAYTIGQNKESSVVYGMPMEAFKLGAVDCQLSLGDISAEILRRL